MRRRDFIKASALGGAIAQQLCKLQRNMLLAEQVAQPTPEGKSPLTSLEFRNFGTVRREMEFQYLKQPMNYGEDPQHWNVRREAEYLYQIEGGKKTDPPNGLRSAVPLGGLGSGTVELRADGSFGDWNIYNNSPASGPKIQIDDTFFGLWMRQENAQPRAAALRTHPPQGLPAVSQIDYAGAFPAARLRFSDPEFPVEATLYAYSEFHVRDSVASATPAAIFTFDLHNPSRQALEVSLLFTVRNYTDGRAAADQQITFDKAGKDPTSGTIAVQAAGDETAITSTLGSDLLGIWNEFSSTGSFQVHPAAEESPKYGALAAQTTLGPGERRTVTFVLAWYLPYRAYKGEVPGNYYTQLYSSAAEVAEKVLGRLASTQQALAVWQRSIFDNSLPTWLQDALINSVATIYKTGLRFANGDMMQWESFSCSGLNPLHIDFYRILPYAFLFPDLHRRMLLEHAESQAEDGFIPEQLTTGCFEVDSDLGKPGGREMGDSATGFLLWAWQIYHWTGDKQDLDSIWSNLKKAAAWQIRRSETYGLPQHLENTYDWWQFGKKDVVSYNAFLHLAALLAAEKLAQVEGETDLARQYGESFKSGQQSLIDHLWAGDYFRSWWLDDKPYPDALHADTLYGQLWACLLDLGFTTEPLKLRAHLASESRLNASPYGLKVMRRAEPEYPELENGVPPDAATEPHARDNLVWEAGSLDWCALELYLDGSVQESLAEAHKVIENWSGKLRDQWDYTDLTTAWDGYPWCNSHYGRQVILWAIPLALAGQHYSAPDGCLSFDPRLVAPAKLPFFTPTATGSLELRAEGDCRLTVVSGTLKLRELRVKTAVLKKSITLQAGESVAVGS
jgi:uncharacterized protein (DUF608 family)